MAEIADAVIYEIRQFKLGVDCSLLDAAISWGHKSATLQQR